MRKFQVYKGTVKKCLVDPYWLKEDGEYSKLGVYQIGSMTESEIRENVKVIDDKAILIETPNGYVDIDFLEKPFAGIKLAFFSKFFAYTDFPKDINNLYLDMKTLEPYYKENLDDRIKIRKLRREKEKNI